MLTISTILYRRSLKLFHLVKLKIYTHQIATPHFLPPPSSWKPPFYSVL